MCITFHATRKFAYLPDAFVQNYIVTVAVPTAENVGHDSNHTNPLPHFAPKLVGVFSQTLQAPQLNIPQTSIK